jgi:hypothetical protein
MFSFVNPGQYYGPAQALYSYKNMDCAVGGGTAVVSVNNYRNADHKHKRDKEGKIVQRVKSSCEDAILVKNALLGVAPDAVQRAGGSVAYMDVFVGKGSPWAIASVLETFAVYSDRFISRYAQSGGSTGKCAAILADDSITWEQTLQQLCDECVGLDCNGFVGNWLKVVQPDFKLNQNSRADDVRAKAKTYRTQLDQIEYWDVMCYAKNEHIAAVNGKGDAPGAFMVCQSAGGGPRMNEYRFIKTGAKTFRLAAPTKQDIGYDFYVISLW